MSSIEFQAELHGEPILALPPEVVERLPKSGRVRVVMQFPNDADDEQWRSGAYEQFMKDDAPEDAMYDQYQ